MATDRALLAATAAYLHQGTVLRCEVCGTTQAYTAEQAATWLEGAVWPAHCGQPMLRRPAPAAP